jgi:hypothetical protein
MCREGFLDAVVAKTDLTPASSAKTLDIGENVLPLDSFTAL